MNYPESLFLVAATYDISGNLSHIIFRNSQPEGISCHGAANISYSNSGKPVFDYKLYYSEDYGALKSDISISDTFPDSGCDFNIEEYINVSSLKKLIDLEDIKIPKDCENVSFRKPRKGEAAMLNTIDAGRKVSVIDLETAKAGAKRYIVELNGKHKYVEYFDLEDVEYTIK